MLLKHTIFKVGVAIAHTISKVDKPIDLHTDVFVHKFLQIGLGDGGAALLHGGEVVYADGEVVGDVRAASYGHTLGHAVGLAMVDCSQVHLHFLRFFVT